MKKEIPMSQEVIDQMPEGPIQPGSLLAMVQQPLISLLWEAATATGLSKINSVEKWFTRKVN